MEEILKELTEKKHGLVFLSAPTNSGKTTLIRVLRETRGDLKALSGEAFFDVVLQSLQTSEDQAPFTQLERYGCVCIEDLDWHRGKECTQYEFANRLTALAQNALVIVTGVELKARLPHLFSKLQDYTYYQKAHEEGTWELR